MIESASDRPDPSSLGDDLLSGLHTQHVHSTRTQVNVECVRRLREHVYVSEKTTIGAKLAALRARSQLSIRDLAAKAGYASASGIQRFLDPTFDKPLALAIATKMADAMAGLGLPPIERREVIALAGFPIEPNAVRFEMEGASSERMRDDLPVYGTALGASRRIEGEAIEQTTLNRAEVLSYARRPVILDGNARAYGLYVSGSSMEPKYEDGEIILVDPKVRFRAGDYVVVYLRPTNAEEDDSETARAALVKKLIRQAGDYVELQQFEPPLVFRISKEEYTAIHRVIPWSELIS